MRNEGIRIDDALDEVFRIAREADIPAEISHLKLAGRASWGRMTRVLARIDSARAAGLDVTADQYPYIAGATSLDASVPAWAHSGGNDSLMNIWEDHTVKQKDKVLYCFHCESIVFLLTLLSFFLFCFDL